MRRSFDQVDEAITDLTARVAKLEGQFGALDAGELNDKLDALGVLTTKLLTLAAPLELETKRDESAPPTSPTPTS